VPQYQDISHIISLNSLFGNLSVNFTTSNIHLTILISAVDNANSVPPFHWLSFNVMCLHYGNWLTIRAAQILQLVAKIRLFWHSSYHHCKTAFVQHWTDAFANAAKDIT